MKNITSKVLTGALAAVIAGLTVRLYHGCMLRDTIVRIRHHNSEISKMLLDEAHEHVTNIAGMKL